MNALLTEENGCYVIEAFKKEGILAAFSNRSWNLRLDEFESPDIAANRKRFCDVLGVDFNHLISLEQVHGAGIVLLGDGPLGDRPSSQDVRPVPARTAPNLEQWVAQKIPKTDATVTQTVGIPFAIHTADCAPVFFFDPESRSVGLAHIGWKGAVQGLAAKMIQVFRAHFKTQPSNLKVVLGPTIGKCCYEVGSEFNNYFSGFVAEKNGKHYCDLTGFIKHELLDAGLSENNLMDTELCTACESEHFFSYRREKDETGRICSVMMIQN